MPGTPCFGDVFHALQEAKKVLRILENMAYGSISKREKMEKEMQKAKKKGKGRTLSHQLKKAQITESRDILVYDELSILISWLQTDIFSLSGPDFETRNEWYDFIIMSLQGVEKLNERRIRPLRRTLENQKDNLLMFVKKLYVYLQEIAQEYKVSISIVQCMLELQALNPRDSYYWKLEIMLRHALG